MDTLKPHLIPILLIGAQVLNTIVFSYYGNYPILHAQIGMSLGLIASLGFFSQYGTVSIPYWKLIPLSRTTYFITKNVLLVLFLLIPWGTKIFANNLSWEALHIQFIGVIIFASLNHREQNKKLQKDTD